MTGLAIRVYGTPAPQGSKRAYLNPHSHTVQMVESSKRVKPWREAVKYAVLEHTVEQITAPLRLSVRFIVPRPRSHYRTGRFADRLKDSAPLYPAGKPDIDKLLRSTLDGLSEAGLFRDDCQVVGFDRLDKAYAEPHDPPGALIHVHTTARTRVGDLHPEVVA